MSNENDDKKDDDGADQGAGSGTDDDEDLLDDEAKNGGKTDDDDKDGKGGKDDDRKDDAQVTKADLADIVKSAVDEANRVADKRINDVLDKRLPKKDDSKKDDGASEPSGVDPALQRGARLAFKEYLDGEDITFLGNEERGFATDLGRALIEGMTVIGDEDTVGREVAKQVADQIRTLRKFYETRTKAALRRKGMLKDPENKGQAAASGAGGVGAGSALDKGKAKAEAMFGAKQ